MIYNPLSSSLFIDKFRIELKEHRGKVTRATSKGDDMIEYQHETREIYFFGKDDSDYLVIWS